MSPSTGTRIPTRVVPPSTSSHPPARPRNPPASAKPASSRQPPPALQPASRDDRSASSGRHPMAEPVVLRPFAVVWLERPFHRLPPGSPSTGWAALARRPMHYGNNPTRAVPPQRAAPGPGRSDGASGRSALGATVPSCGGPPSTHWARQVTSGPLLYGLPGRAEAVVTSALGQAGSETSEHGEALWANWAERRAASD